MSHSTPELKDYLNLFQMYGEDLGSIYKEPEDDRYAFLFEQCVKLLIQASEFNFSLPEPFRHSAHRYHDNEPDTVKHLSEPINRHFMLCDLHDFVKLKAYMAKHGVSH